MNTLENKYNVEVTLEDNSTLKQNVIALNELEAIDKTYNYVTNILKLNVVDIKVI